MALQAALYVGSVAMVVLVTALIVLQIQLHRQIERVVRAVEELKAEVLRKGLETFVRKISNPESAPRTGKDARTWLARNTREIKDRATSAFEQAKDTIRRETESARREAREFASALDLNH
jgi:hypothetical protein